MSRWLCESSLNTISTLNRHYHSPPPRRIFSNPHHQHTTLPYRYHSYTHSSLPHTSTTVHPSQSPAKPRSTMVLTPDQWPAKKVRDTFLNFFKERRHTFGSCPIFNLTCTN